MRSPELNDPSPSGPAGDAHEPDGIAVDPVDVALRAAISERLPARRIVGVQRRPAPYRSSRWLEYVTVHLDDGSMVQLVYKDFVRSVPGSDAHLIKPADVMVAAREPWVYRHVLRDPSDHPSSGRTASDASGAPVRWCEVDRPGGGVAGLLLERVEGVPLTEVGDTHAWHSAARWLARFHDGRTPPRPAEGPLLEHDRNLHERWLARATAAGPFDPLDGHRRDHLRAAHRRALDLVFDGPAALLHGEFYPSNLVVRRVASGWSIHPVDWEMAGPGPAVLDLAALTSGAWGTAQRRGIAASYHLASDAYAGVAAESFLRRLTAAHLLVAVQWLGWANHAWSPPAAHRTNWLETALECAEDLT